MLPAAARWLLCMSLLSNSLWMLVLGGWAALAGRSRRIREGRRLTWKGWLVTPFALALLGLGVWFQIRGGQGMVAFIVGLAFPVYMCMGGAAQPWSGQFNAIAYLWPFIVLVFPLASALVFSAISLWNRVPLTVGLARGFRGMALPVACFLVLLYSGAVISTAREQK